jgi:molybdopterin converting factor subunit 1
MTVNVHLFARAREIAATPTAKLDLPAGATAGDLRRALGDRYPALAPILAISSIAVNHEFADDAKLIAEGDELAVIPPVSGG